MKRIIKQDLSITLAVLAIAIFAFFFWMYPYHLFHKEQMMLFLYSGEFLRGYFQEEAWLACLTGDFLTQFFYYIGGGPFILSVVLTLFALLTYRTFRQFVSKRYALPLMILLVLWEAGRSCGLAYPLSATLSLIGAEGVFLLYSRSQTEGQRLLTCIPAMLLCYWCFGYGAWLCLALMLAAGIIAHHQKLSALLAVGILLLPATQYPATTWWSKPDLDREYVLSLDVEHYFGNIQDEETSRDRPPNPLGDLLPEPVQCHASVRDQLTRISLPEPPSVESTGYEWVDPSREPICFFSLYPIRQRVMVHVRRYDYGRALRHAKYDLLSSQFG